MGLWVVGPLSCFRPWEEEFAACFGRAPMCSGSAGPLGSGGGSSADAHRHELVLCTYHTAWREETALVPVLTGRPWLLVLDEAHYVKSMTGVLAATVRHLGHTPHVEWS